VLPGSKSAQLCPIGRAPVSSALLWIITARGPQAAGVKGTGVDPPRAARRRIAWASLLLPKPNTRRRLGVAALDPWGLDPATASPCFRLCRRSGGIDPDGRERAGIPPVEVSWPVQHRGRFLGAHLDVVRPAGRARIASGALSAALRAEAHHCAPSAPGQARSAKYDGLRRWSYMRVKRVRSASAGSAIAPAGDPRARCPWTNAASIGLHGCRRAQAF
jgi:hypothetical protein